MEFIYQKFLNYYNDSIWDETSSKDSDDNSIHKEVTAMKDLNDIDTEQQQQWWD